ncbi:MAG: hypothetical protein DRR08_02435 [Candidatus Parabeggiatoa sp. nov. 2]|nr:MAG: hypothetical protein B6247_20990 [Beggiatoa sp. 4572_84]RKZ63874.1 MAG: hypothetical protein DRR08_02435 [Gammaproteobacteria bacterium]
MAPKRTLLLESKASALAFGIQREVTYRYKRGATQQFFRLKGLVKSERVSGLKELYTNRLKPFLAV